MTDVNSPPDRARPRSDHGPSETAYRGHPYRDPHHAAERARRDARTPRPSRAGLLQSSALAASASCLIALGAACNNATFTISGGGGEGQGGAGQGGEVNQLPEFAPAAGGLRRLIARQYVGSVRELLGDAAAAVVVAPADLQLRGLEAIAARELSHEPESIELYEYSSRLAAAAAVADPATLASILPCTATGPSDALCLEQFVTEMGRRAWRRPLEADEVTRVVGAGLTAATELGTFEAALEASLSALMQSPNFLYVVELGEPIQDAEGQFKLTPFELVTRMSFFLRDRAPSEALLDAAESGQLDTPEGVRAIAAQMLEDPATKTSVRDFFGELFSTRELPELSKDQALFPTFDDAVKQAMVEEAYALVDDIVWTRDADFHELLTANYSFINDDLAEHYGMSAPGSSTLVKTSWPASQKRAGMLGQGAFLARFSHPSETSPTRRGIFVRTILLCEQMDPPPPSANPTLPEQDPNNPLNKKELLQKHKEDPTCAGCHNLVDPVGLALENYDAAGAFRTEDVGGPIDPAVINDVGEYASSAELGAALAAFEDGAFARCMTRQLFRQSMGHVEEEGESRPLYLIDEAFSGSGFSLQELMVEIVVSDAFTIVGDPR